MATHSFYETKPTREISWMAGGAGVYSDSSSSVPEEEHIAVLVDELDTRLLQRIRNRVGLFISPSKESVGRVQGC